MKTVDHYLIGEKMMEKMVGKATPIQRTAFLFGCIEPDINPFTYLKGSVHYQKLHGHNYQNASKVIQEYITDLQRSEVWSVKSCYTFGKLLHYITDAFTFPHNEEFTGNIREHLLYENELHELLEGELSSLVMKNERTIEECSYTKFRQIHSEYIRQRVGMKDDLHYIFNICIYFYFSFFKMDGVTA